VTSSTHATPHEIAPPATWVSRSIRSERAAEREHRITTGQTSRPRPNGMSFRVFAISRWQRFPRGGVVLGSAAGRVEHGEKPPRTDDRRAGGLNVAPQPAVRGHHRRVLGLGGELTDQVIGCVSSTPGGVADGNPRVVALRQVRLSTSSTRVTGSPRHCRRASRRRTAAGRSRHQPSATAPTTLLPSITRMRTRSHVRGPFFASRTRRCWRGSHLIG
jgi:hypothetical protein